jgi:WD40 repeat protein
MIFKRLTLFFLFVLVKTLVQAQEPRLVLPVGHTANIVTAKFSPDDRYIATAANDKTAKIWDARTGKLLADLKGHIKDIVELNFNAAGDRILTLSNLDTAAKLWDAKTGLLIKNLRSGNYAPEFAIFYPDGNKILLSSDDYALKIIDANTGVLIRQLKGQSNNKCAAISSDGKRIVSSASYSTSKVWDAQTGELIFELKESSGMIQKVGFTPDNKKIYTSNYDKTLKIWDATTGILQYDLPNQEDWVDNIAISNDSKRLLFSHFRGQFAKLYDLENGKLIANLPRHQYPIKTLKFSPDNKVAITGELTNALKIIDANTGSLISEIKSFAPDCFQFLTGNIFVSNDEKETVKLIEAVNGNRILNFDGLSKIELTSFSSDGKKMVVATENSNFATIWDVLTGKKLAELNGLTSTVRSAALTPDEKYLLVDDYRLYNISDGILSSLIAPINESSLRLQYSPNGKYIAKMTYYDKYRLDGIVSLWDAQTLKVIDVNLQKKGMQRISYYYPGSLVFSADSKKLFITNRDWASYLFDAATGNMTDAISHSGLYYVNLNYSGTKFLAAAAPKITVMDFIEKKSTNEITVPDFYNGPSYINKQNQFLLYTPKAWQLYDEMGTKPIFEMKSGKMTLNQDTSKAIVEDFDEFRAYDLKEKKQLLHYKHIGYERIRSTDWINNGKFIVFDGAQDTIKVMDATTGKVVNTTKGYFNKVVNSKDQKYTALILNEKASIFNADSFTKVTELKGHAGDINSLIYLPGNKKILTIASDQTSKVWDLKSGKLIYTYLLLSPEFNFSQIPSGYYMATPEASKLVYYVTKDLKFISFEQLDVKYNRPDKVLQVIGSTDTAMISSYRKAYEKRIKKLGIDTTAFKIGYSVPEADFKNRTAISYDQNSEKLTLQIKATDQVYPLERLNIWVNEVPIFGMKGISLKKNKKNFIDTTITITLSQGENQIETSVLNSNGTESYRIPLLVNYKPQQPVSGKVYFAGIGINQFEQKENNLQWSVKDIRDLTEKLKQKYGDTFVLIDTLYDQKVTIANIIKLKEKLKKSSVNDKVIIAFSGHGLLSKNYDYYLSTYAINFNKPEEKGLAYEQLEDLMDGIPARQKLMLIDACHSGEVDKEEMANYAAVKESLNKNGIKGVEVVNKDKSKIGMKNSFELMQELFVNVNKSTGTTVISAAGGMQYALEQNNLKNGVFTYSILETLVQHSKIKVSELKKIVAARVLELTSGLQKPTSRNENIAVDWDVW